MQRLSKGRVFRLTMVSAMALSAGRCKCSSNGPANLTACSHVTNAKKDLQTFVQNHPVNGAPDPQSQIAVLGHMIAELDAARQESPNQDITFELNAAITDASQMQQAIGQGKPVTSAALISDFDNLASLCGQFGSDITVP